MKKLALPILAMVGLLAPLATSQAAVATPMLALPQLPTQTMPVSCADKLADTIEKMQAPGMINHVRATSTLLVGETAYAESCGSNGLCSNDGTAAWAGADIVGTSKVGTPVSTDRSNLGFRITNVDGTAKLKWSFKGKQYIGAVKSCSNGYWTAGSASSAIAIKLSSPIAAPT
jgi:hypothetical protein